MTDLAADTHAFAIENGMTDEAAAPYLQALGLAAARAPEEGLDRLAFAYQIGYFARMTQEHKDKVKEVQRHTELTEHTRVALQKQAAASGSPTMTNVLEFVRRTG